ncbi:complement factor H-like isoform 2-T2 [Menidia menidia]
MHLIFHSCVFFLWMQTLTFVRACTVESFKTSRFYDSNFDTTGLEDSYAGGAQVRVPCSIGYSGFFKMICTDSGWSPTPGSSKCRPKSCGHPGEAQFADFRLDKGEDFVFGSEVVYTCRDGYQMVSRTSRRRCTANGWDGVVPVCEILKCPVPVIDDNVNVNGDPEDSTVGNLLRFDCKNDNEILSGPSQIYCAENGQWNEQPPTCGELRCVKPTIENGYVLSGTPHYKEHQVLNFDCNTDYKRGNERLPQCSKAGSRAVWIPTPECRPIKCQLLLSAEGTSYNPPNRNVFSPNEKLRISCGSDYWIINTKTTETEVTCKDDGEWSSDPKCKEVRCSYPTDPNVYSWGATWGQKKLRSKVQYSCKTGFDKPQGITEAECTRDGWIPNPLCEGTKCDKPHVENAGIRPERNSYRNRESVRIDCLYGDKTFEMTCQRGAWTGMQSCPGKACSKPTIENGFVVGPFGEVAYYSCDENYKLYTKGWWDEVKCTDNVWSPPQKCIGKNMCGEPPVIPNSRRPLSEVGQNLDIVCNPGYTRSIRSLTCSNGNWDLDGIKLKEICTSDGSNCGPPPKISNTVVKMPYQKEFPSGSSVTYMCRDHYKLITAGHPTLTCDAGKWEQKIIDCVPYCDMLEDKTLTTKETKERYEDGEDVQYQCKSCENTKGTATCKNGNWEKSVDCEAPCETQDGTQTTGSDCSSPPLLDNGDIKDSLKQEYKHDEKVEYVCQAWHIMEGGPFRKCVDGEWTGEITCLKPCTVNEDDMTANNIQLIRGEGKIYLTHGDHITFECTGRKSRVGSVAFRQMCKDGVITLPRCE